MNDRRFHLWGIPVLALLIALLNGPYAGANAPARFVVMGGRALLYGGAVGRQPSAVDVAVAPPAPAWSKPDGGCRRWRGCRWR